MLERDSGLFSPQGVLSLLILLPPCCLEGLEGQVDQFEPLRESLRLGGRGSVSWSSAVSDGWAAPVCFAPQRQVLVPLPRWRHACRGRTVQSSFDRSECAVEAVQASLDQLSSTEPNSSAG